MPSEIDKSSTITFSPPSEWLREFDVTLRHRSGPLDLDVHFTINAPWTALFAPSGAGKTTILRMIAGLEHPDSGRIVYTGQIPPFKKHERVLLDSRQRIFTPPHIRYVRMAAQRPALFPHLSVAANVSYGLHWAVRDEQEQLSHDQQMQDLHALCRITHLMDKMPAQLSGGERQRVALARTIGAGNGRLLMLDEPFTGVESDLRDDLIRDLKAWCQKTATPVLLVTHDIGEVFAAQAHVLRMEVGRIVASGPAAEVLATERGRLIQRLQP